jgi:peptide methionine sulfoxide reductase msrA/msrB
MKKTLFASGAALFLSFLISVLISGLSATVPMPSAHADDRATERPADFKKPTKADLKKLLTPQQYNCTQEEGTDAPFHNAYWNNHADGLYVDLISGEPLFSSLDKYDSGTGWPSFTKPIDESSVTTRKDHKLLDPRTELRSKKADSHLGHVFTDGPKETGGLRFCINSSSLKFVPLDEMKAKGYGRYLFAFAKQRNWEIATLAGGCFWGMEDILRKIPGVVETQAGYTGGTAANATYDSVHEGKTGHAESVQILFDPKKLSYEDLLLQFFKMHDPTTLNRQGNDVGTQYRSAIFYNSKQQKETAEKVKARVAKSGQWKKPIVTEIVPLGAFWRAEDYHQKYLVAHPNGYTCHFVRDLKF